MKTMTNIRTQILEEAETLINGPHADSAVDGCGYLALGAEVSVKEENK